MTPGETSVLTQARPRSSSLRTTVPSGIVSQFDLKEGDGLDWTIKAENGNLVLIVKPTKSKNRK
jgi:bifunctional DNA-binding transcriptional regulator/antitoxin component of YhaV-PrlF toxin-antitoxin module